MGRNNYFQFKQFKIIQEKAAMKVGTDGVLLGAWTNIEEATHILDIGTGSGVIALMLAQRTMANIIGVEIEKNAAKEAGENVKNSPWANRVTIINSSFQKFENTTQLTYDLIVSNPPFFINDKKSQNSNLAIAKHNHLLPLPDLINGSFNLMKDRGKLAVILPVIPAQKLIDYTKQKGLFLNKLTEVKSNNLKNTHRFMMEFSKYQTILKKDYLTIYNDDGADYSEVYKKITREFYLNF